jgi:hypothetical protein
LDIIIGIVIFIGALLLFFKSSLADTSDQNRGIDDLLLDAKLISGYLTSEGYPANWTKDTVISIGITDGSLALDVDKLKNFSSIAEDDYRHSRQLLSTSYDYYVYFQDKDNNTLTIGGVERVGKNYTDTDPDDIVKIVRFINYESEIIKMVLLVY